MHKRLATSALALLLASCASTDVANEQVVTVAPEAAESGAEVATLATPAKALEAAPAAAATPRISDTSTTKDVHLAYIIPGSDVLFAAESEPPTTDAEWKATMIAAQKVIDGANLLMAGSRPPGSSDWMMYAGAVTSATRVTMGALSEKNADDLVFTNGDMMTGCTSCHQQFRK